MLTKMQMYVVKVQWERETVHSGGQLACDEKCLFNWQLDASYVLSQLSCSRGRIARAGEATVGTLEYPVNGLKGRRTKNPLKVSASVRAFFDNPLDTSGHSVLHWVATRSDPWRREARSDKENRKGREGACGWQKNGTLKDETSRLYKFFIP